MRISDWSSDVCSSDLDDAVLRLHGADLAKLPHLKWLGYLSTTGVYGDSGGDWVDETTPLRPTQARSIRRAAAEAAWLKLHEDHGLPVHVFRLAGIYGPGRNQLEGVKRGTAHCSVKTGPVFCSIHVDDIVQVLPASMARPAPGAGDTLARTDPA